MSTVSPNQVNRVRQLSINFNHWYVVARTNAVSNTPVNLVIWQQAMALYRDNNGIMN